MRALRLAVFAGAVMVAAPLSAQAPAQGQAQRGDPAAMQARQNEALFAGITSSRAAVCASDDAAAMIKCFSASGSS